MTVNSVHQLDLPHAAEARLAVTLGPELRRLADRARRLSAEVFAPIAATGTYGRVNRKLIRALGEHDVLSEVFPAADRDLPQRQVSAQRLALLKEYLALECTAAEDALGLQGLGFYPIWRWGNAAQIERWYGGVVAGTTVVAYALTEPEAGSDTAAMQLSATQTADGYRLNGTKIYISNAPEADLYVVFARTSDTGRRGVTAFLVPGDVAGLDGQAIELIMSHPVGQLDFHDVLVGDDAVLGPIGAGYDIAMQTLELFRISVGAFALGCAQAATDTAIRHAGTRRQFGAPLAQMHGVGHRLADMVTATAAARLLVYYAAEQYDAGVQPIRQLSAMAKLQATETAQWVVDAAIQLHGALALRHDHLLGHLYKEVRAPRIYEGASEVLRSVIAHDLYRTPISAGTSSA